MSNEKNNSNSNSNATGYYIKQKEINHELIVKTKLSEEFTHVHDKEKDEQAVVMGNYIVKKDINLEDAKKLAASLDWETLINIIVCVIDFTDKIKNSENSKK